ncbi:MAG: GNAT family N-acetyltransferase [Lactobacillales bacterium]|nr:GNAT family N-acetyltransferase [Lactobacillales bacterium]
MKDKIEREGIILRRFRSEDMENFWVLSYGRTNLEWLNWNGPYFNDPIYTKEEFMKKIVPRYIHSEKRYAIEVAGEVIGEISWYYEDKKLERWLEIGLAIFDNAEWGQGYGSRALKLWIDYLFNEVTDLPHIGLTTWSGNERMLKVAQKVGLKEEGCIRKVRYWQEKYWDSMKFGVLREEWRITPYD